MPVYDQGAVSVCNQGAMFLSDEGVVTRVCVQSKATAIIRRWLSRMPMLCTITGLP